MSTGNGQRHTVTHADSVFVGSAQYNAYQGGKRGIEWPHIFMHEFGQVEAKDTDGICALVTATATGVQSLTINGQLASGGVATMTTPRAIRLTSTGNESSRTFTVTGTDVYGETLVETITGPNNTTADGKKAFKTVTSITISGQMTASDMIIGTNDVLGLPVRLPDLGKFSHLSINGDPVASTPVAGMAATGTSTATTADVRGTVLATTVPNGSLYFTAFYRVDHTARSTAFGAAQYGG